LFDNDRKLFIEIYRKQDNQGRYPLKPLKDNTIQENAILFY